MSIIRVAPKKFDPKTMKVDKNDPRVIYASNRTIEESVASPESGYILIGIKDNPTKKKLAEVIRHEKSHVVHRASIPFVGIASLDALTSIRKELQAYSQERKSSSPREWNKVLPSRIKQFMGYLTWVSKLYQAKIKPQAKRILSPKKAGGNVQAVAQAQADLARWWLVEEKVPTRLLVVATKRPIEEIRQELSRGQIGKPQYIKPGIAYTSGGRLSRNHRRGWKRVRLV